MEPGDYIFWGEQPNVHIWLVKSVFLGVKGQESLVEIENVSHKPGVYFVGATSFGIHKIAAETMFVPECLLRGLRTGREAV